MHDIINLLPDAIANQIAAGEVVQRPASAVKELLENAIDAQASHIQLIIKDAGKVLIQVIDNGIGMSETDARMCFERHATSKIRSSDDLFTLRTMGFRGEAMASIAAVAQVEMRTRRQADELGVLIKIDGSDLKTHEACQCNQGTNIQVKNLFFNVPARRNFLKSNPVEMKHILDEFQHIALAHPTLSFSFYNNDEEVYQLNPGKLGKRILDLFGKNYQPNLVPVQEETDLLQISGYVGKPDSAKKTRNEQFFFVNKRYVRSGYLHHALLSAYAGMLEEGAHPFYVIFLEIDPKHIDINVHPTKTEIKFDDERSIYAVLSAAVRRAMSQFHMTPTIDFEADQHVDFLFGGGTQSRQSVPGNTASQNRDLAHGGLSPLPKTNLGNWEKLYEGLEIKPFERNTPKPDAETLFNATIYPKTEHVSQPIISTTVDPKGLGSAVIQIHNQYIISQVKSGIMLIDQKLAYERIQFDQLMACVEKGTAPSQALMFPETIALSPGDYLIYTEIQQEVADLGFGLSPIGNNSLMLNAIPANLIEDNATGALEAVLEQYKNSAAELGSTKKENLVRATAKRIAGRFQKRLQSDEITALIDQLFASTNPQISPNGANIMSIVSLEKLGELLR